MTTSALDGAILKELRILNAQMKVLVEEHLKHFKEWREKNG